MSSAPQKPLSARGESALNEVRYSLREMMVEVTTERQSGSMGAEKLHRKDIRKLFRAKPRKPRDTQT
jgi:hypothetical protein